MSAWPFVTKRRLLREVTEIGQSYRREIEEANARARRADQQFNSLVRSVASQKDVFTDTMRFYVEIERYFLLRDSQGELAERLTRRIMDVLLRTHEDWRRNALTGAVTDLRSEGAKG